MITNLLHPNSDTLLSTKLFLEAVNQIKKRKKLDTSYDIPYLAGYSNDGKTIYIDRHLPSHLTFNNKNVSIYNFLILHESVEKALIDELGLSYISAHEIAEDTEEDAVEAFGIPLKQYNRFMRQYIKKSDNENIERIPKNLDMTPYIDENDTKLIEKMKKAMK
jgi:hypothetical protein